MKEMGFPISYCKEWNNYYCQEEGNMVTSLFENGGMRREELNKINNWMTIKLL